MPKQQFFALEGNSLFWSDTGREKKAGLFGVSEEVVVTLRGRGWCD